MRLHWHVAGHVFDTTDAGLRPDQAVAGLAGKRAGRGSEGKGQVWQTDTASSVGTTLAGGTVEPAEVRKKLQEAAGEVWQPETV